MITARLLLAMRPIFIILLLDSRWSSMARTRTKLVLMAYDTTSSYAATAFFPYDNLVLLVDNKKKKQTAADDDASTRTKQIPLYLSCCSTASSSRRSLEEEVVAPTAASSSSFLRSSSCSSCWTSCCCCSSFRPRSFSTPRPRHHEEAVVVEKTLQIVVLD